MKSVLKTAILLIGLMALSGCVVIVKENASFTISAGVLANNQILTSRSQTTLTGSNESTMDGGGTVETKASAIPID